MLVTPPPPAEKLTPEERRKAAYRFIAAAFEEHIPYRSDVSQLPPDVQEEIGRFIRTVAAAGAVSVTVPAYEKSMTEEPKLTTPAVAALATTKVNGSH